MPAGLQVYNDDGLVQIDSDWSNYALVSTQTINTVDTNWRGLPSRAAIHTGSLEGDLVFAHCASLCYLLGVGSYNGQRCVGVSVGYSPNGALGVPVTFYVFRKQPPSPSTYGLQIYDANGVLVFDAASDFARIVGTVPAVSSTSKFFLPTNNKYAVLMPSFSGQYVQDSEFNSGQGPNFWWYIYANCLRLRCDTDGIQMSGMGIGAYTQIPANAQGPVQVNTIQGPPILVARVTGFD